MGLRIGVRVIIPVSRICWGGLQVVVVGVTFYVGKLL